MTWINIDDKMPTNDKLERFRVKMLVGSMTVDEVETVLLGRMYPTGYRFMAGDWQRVTHWWDENNEQ